MRPDARPAHRVSPTGEPLPVVNVTDMAGKIGDTEKTMVKYDANKNTKGKGINKSRPINNKPSDFVSTEEVVDADAKYASLQPERPAAAPNSSGRITVKFPNARNVFPNKKDAKGIKITNSRVLSHDKMITDKEEAKGPLWGAKTAKGRTNKPEVFTNKRFEQTSHLQRPVGQTAFPKLERGDGVERRPGTHGTDYTKGGMTLEDRKLLAQLHGTAEPLAHKPTVMMGKPPQIGQENPIIRDIGRRPKERSTEIMPLNVVFVPKGTPSAWVKEARALSSPKPKKDTKTDMMNFQYWE